MFSSQQIFTEVYRLGHYFPLAFAACAIGVAIAGFVNARFVGRLGMRVISHGALLGFVVVSAAMLVAARTGTLGLPLFMALSALMMFAFGLMIANFTALAMEPQGRIAGTASSLYGSITTLASSSASPSARITTARWCRSASTSSSARWPRWRWSSRWKKAACSGRIAPGVTVHSGGGGTTPSPEPFRPRALRRGHDAATGSPAGHRHWRRPCRSRVVTMPDTDSWQLRDGEQVIAMPACWDRRHFLIGITRVRNEALVISDTLDYVGKQVDAIIAYDDASTDRTLEILRQHPKSR